MSAGIVGPLKGDCSLDTSGGDVRAKVSHDAAFNLDASTSGGDVKADGLTITIEKGGVGRSKLAGKVNGGGVWARTEAALARDIPPRAQERQALIVCSRGWLRLRSANGHVEVNIAA